MEQPTIARPETLSVSLGSTVGWAAAERSPSEEELTGVAKRKAEGTKPAESTSGAIGLRPPTVALRKVRSTPDAKKHSIADSAQVAVANEGGSTGRL